MDRMDPDVAEAHGTYQWDQVPPHSTGHSYCQTKRPEGMGKPEEGFKPGGKDRKIPEKFTGQGDSFTGEMIKKYAIEGGKSSKDKKPNGQFWFEFEGARQAAKEVLQ